MSALTFNKKMVFVSDAIRHALAVAVSVAIAYALTQYLTVDKGYWMLFTALVIGQASKGAPVTIAARYFLVILLAYLFAYALLYFVKQPIVIYVITAILFVIAGTLIFISQPAPMKMFFLLALAPFVVMLKVLNLKIVSSLQNDIFQILLGAAIGIICVRLFAKRNLYQEFKQGVLPILEAYLEYSKILATRFTLEKNSIDAIARKKWLLEKVLQSDPGTYPEWIFEVGFNPGLRGGFRYFLLQLDKISEVLFSLNYLANQHVTSNLLQNIKAPLLTVFEKNDEILSILIAYFKTNKLPDDSHIFARDNHQANDFTSDIAVLEAALRDIVPKSLELLDISPEYVTITAIVRDLKDLRELLLQSIMALPKVAFEKPLLQPTIH